MPDAASSFAAAFPPGRATVRLLDIEKIGKCAFPAMKLPGAPHAVVDISKLRDYCLNPLHPRGRHKARVFASALHMVQTDAELLKTKLLTAVLEHDAVPGEADEYGKRYIVDFDCVH